jgi:hypothetical protein
MDPEPGRISQLLRITESTPGEGLEAPKHAGLALIQQTTLPSDREGQDGRGVAQIHEIEAVGAEPCSGHRTRISVRVQRPSPAISRARYTPAATGWPSMPRPSHT